MLTVREALKTLDETVYVALKIDQWPMSQPHPAPCTFKRFRSQRSIAPPSPPFSGGVVANSSSFSIKEPKQLRKLSKEERERHWREDLCCHGQQGRPWEIWEWRPKGVCDHPLLVWPTSRQDTPSRPDDAWNPVLCHTHTHTYSYTPTWKWGTAATDVHMSINYSRTLDPQTQVLDICTYCGSAKHHYPQCPLLLGNGEPRWTSGESWLDPPIPSTPLVSSLR